MENENLTAINLHKSYNGKMIVKGVGLYVNRGEIIGLLGPNGAGKTTSFYMIAGLVRADKGSIYLSGEELTKDPIHIRAMKGIGYLPQENSVFRDINVEKNISSVLEHRKLSKAEKKHFLEDLLKDFDLGRIRYSKGRELSGGERRRVEVARTLALGPRFILLDEPFAGVDPISVNDIQNVIRKLRDRNIGILITDHNVRETFDIVDRAYIINSGKILIQGTPKEILSNQQARTSYLGKGFKM